MVEQHWAEIVDRSGKPTSNITRAARNRTLTLTAADRDRLRPKLIAQLPSQISSQMGDRPVESHPASNQVLPQGTIHGDCLQWAQRLPQEFVDLLILDPPYNLDKTFHDQRFTRCSIEEYGAWLERVIVCLKPLLKPTASIYICGDWFSSVSIFPIASAHFIVRNRITWEREKGRGAKRNWKNSGEDIWFCTRSDSYTFNVNAVKLRRRVLAPYRSSTGTPKDWQSTTEGNFRDTHPSNLWTDITVPFWSMPENTDHPTQKSEKLLARLILASTQPNDFVFDPFLGSGTSSVVAKKLGRRYLGIELQEEYCLLAEKRLEQASTNCTIQGYGDGVFWERNTAIGRSSIPSNPSFHHENLEQNTVCQDTATT